MSDKLLIKKLQNSQLRGAPFDTKTLQRLGISSALAQYYVKSGWLEKLGRGVFMFPGDELTRDSTVKFLESRIPGLHVAAKTALAIHGYRQNLAHRETVILWGEKRATLPEWFSLKFPARYNSYPLFKDDTTQVPRRESQYGPRVSAPERALLEMLSEVGVHQEVDEAKGIMENVRHLRMHELAVLLTNCRMVKAVRLCVNWSNELELPWAEEARSAVNDKLGSTRWVKQLNDGSTLILKP